MSRGNEMQSLVDNIKVSSDCRAKTLQDVVSSTQKTLSDLKKESSAAKSIWQSLSKKNSKIMDEEVKVKKSKKVE